MSYLLALAIAMVKYRVEIKPPILLEIPSLCRAVHKVRPLEVPPKRMRVFLGDRPVLQANALVVHLYANRFARKSGSAHHPPEEVMQRATTSFIKRYRHVGTAAAIRPFRMGNQLWTVEYLRNDEPR
jgi:hypothetical protein